MKNIFSSACICVLLSSFLPQQSMAVSIKDLSSAIDTASPERLPSYYLYRSKAYLDMGDHTKALADIESSLKVKPTEEAYLTRGNFYRENNRLDEAIRDYSSALEINEHFLKAYKFRSQAYYDQKKYVNAIVDATRITFYDEENPFAHNMIEKCYLETSPRERIVIRSNVAKVMRLRKALVKKGPQKRYSPPSPPRKTKTASAAPKKKKKCGPRRRS